MPSDLKDLLDRAADRPSTEPDFAALARTGRRRRHTQRATSALAVVAVIALTSTVVLPKLRPPSVAFDTAPRSGVGTWQSLPPSPLGGRVEPLVASDDRRVVVLGGRRTGPEPQQPAPEGAAYDVAAATWTPLPRLPLVADHIEMTEDGRLLALQYSPLMASFYDFTAQDWVSTGGAPVGGRVVEVVAWTGKELVVWGGFDGQKAHGDGAVWSAAEGWRAMADSPLAARAGASWAWTGDQLLIWGGGTGGGPIGGEETVLDDGAAYDPETDSWTAMADSPLQGRRDVNGVWTGDELIIAGGYGGAIVNESVKASEAATPETTVSESCRGLVCSGSATVEGGAEPSAQRVFSDGARYNPAADSWETLVSAPRGYRGEVRVTDDDRLIAEGEQGWTEYDPGEDAWMVREPLPDVHAEVSAADTLSVAGHTVLLNSGDGDVFMADLDRTERLGGVALDDAKPGGWMRLAEADTPQRFGAAVAVVGRRVFVWGGYEPAADHDDGAILTMP